LFLEIKTYQNIGRRKGVKIKDNEDFFFFYFSQ